MLLQIHFAAQVDSGQVLAPVPRFFATGSTWLSSWVGWAAGACFLLATYNVRFGHADPPYGTDEKTPVPRLRDGVRREYRWVRIALVALTAASLFELGRLIALIFGALNNVAYSGTQVPVVAVEGAGVCLATVVLALWAHWFRKRLAQWNAI